MAVKVMRLSEVGARLGTWTHRDGSLCYVLEIEVPPVWVFEFNGQGSGCVAEEDDYVATTAADRERVLMEKSPKWLPDNETTFELSDRLFPYRFQREAPRRWWRFRLSDR